jgi:copper chaperone CopZ
MHRIIAVLLMGALTAGVMLAETGKSNTVKVSVSGMMCKSCAAKVEKALMDVKGVESVKVSLENKSAEVTLASNSKVSADVLVKAVSKAGFKASSGKSVATPKKSAQGDKEAMDCSKDCAKDGKSCEEKPTK